MIPSGGQYWCSKLGHPRTVLFVAAVETMTEGHELDCVMVRVSGPLLSGLTGDDESTQRKRNDNNPLFFVTSEDLMRLCVPLDRAPE